MKRQKIILSVIVVSTGFALFGCQSRLSQPNLFDTSACRAPCWQTVTPGVTTEKDALAIFAKFADSHGISDVADPYTDGYDNNITFSPSIGGGSVFADTLNGRISVMKFEGSFGDNITLKHAIELFGEPESVVVEEFGEWDQIILLLPKNGIAFGWPILGSSPRAASGRAEISPNSSIGLIWLFDPSQYELFSNAYGFAGLTKNDLHPWVGYGSIKEKYWPPVSP